MIGLKVRATMSELKLQSAPSESPANTDGSLRVRLACWIVAYFFGAILSHLLTESPG